MRKNTHSAPWGHHTVREVIIVCRFSPGECCVVQAVGRGELDCVFFGPGPFEINACYVAAGRGCAKKKR